MTINDEPPVLDDDDSWADEVWHDAHCFDESHLFNESTVSLYHDAVAPQHDEEDEDPAHEDKDDTFRVSREELETLKQALESPEYFGDAYLASVASKPYSKDPSVRRPLEYTLEKLTQVLRWRKELRASELPDWISILNNLPPRQAATKLDSGGSSSNDYAKARAMVESLNAGSMYWHGLTRDGRPVLWIRTERKPWFPNVEAEVDALVAMADAGIRHGMPAGVTDFCCVSHSHKPPPPNPSFAYEMLKGLVRGYPDRMHSLTSAPVSGIVEFCMGLLLPLMPGRLAHKFAFYSLEHAQSKLNELLWRGAEDVPAFFGGCSREHDELYPPLGSCPNRGEGSLRFDWYGMIQRLQQNKTLFEQQQQQQQQPIANGH